MTTVALLMLALLVLPLATLTFRTLASPDGLHALAGSALLSAAGLSLGTSAISVGIIVGLGTPLAYLLARYSFPGWRLLSLLVELPVVLPPVVAGLALLMTFGRRGLLGGPLEMAGITLPFSTAAVVIAQVFVAAPFFIRAAQVQFTGISAELEEAARIDGATDWQMFWHVTAPLSARGLLGGLALSWARALGEFGATMLFAGNLQGRTQTMPLLVYSALERDLDAALWAGLVLVWVAMIALGLMRWLVRGAERRESPRSPDY